MGDIFSDSDSTGNTIFPKSPPRKKRPAKSSRKLEASSAQNLEEFEEAFTVLKSIQSAHDPLSYTSINALLHYNRGINTNKRTLPGLLWPEHTETLATSRLIESSLVSESKITDNFQLIPQLYADSDDSTIEPSCETEMCQSPVLHKALIRVCQSIWRQRTDQIPSEINPHLSHVIARRSSLLLQSIFKRAHLNRRSALNLLQSFPQNSNRDLDNVPVNWEDVREATRQLVGQAALDQETFVKFKIRLESSFKNK